MSNYSFELIPKEISNLFIQFSFIKDDSKSNYDNFKFLVNNKNILIYNLNDKYYNDKSLFELTKYMMIRYYQFTGKILYVEYQMDQTNPNVRIFSKT